MGRTADATLDGRTFFIVIPGLDQEKWDRVLGADVTAKFSQGVLKRSAAALIYLAMAPP